MNTQTEKTFEDSREELAGQPLEFFVPEPFRERHGGHRALFRELRARPLGADQALFASRKNETQFPVEISSITFQFCGVKLESSAILDVSKRKYAEESRRIFREKEALLSDIYHRVKDNLRVVSSLQDLQAGRLLDADARPMFEASQSRIRFMALGLRLVKVLMLTRQLDGELRAAHPGGPKFEIVFPPEAPIK